MLLAEYGALPAVLKAGQASLSRLLADHPMVSEAILATRAAMLKSLQVELRAGTQPGDVTVLRGKGVPVLNGRGRGDHRVLVNVMLPQRLTDDQRRLLAEFEAAVAEDTYKPDESFLGRIRSAFSG